MNFEYHRKTLLASDTDHPMVREALALLPRVEQAQRDLVEHRIDIQQYITEITDYDRFMYTRAKQKPQKSNPINTLQNKKYSTWREQKWAPIWELIRQDLAEAWDRDDLTVIQNKSVVESVYSSGYKKFKDVDGGIAFEHDFNGRRQLVAVIAVEDKGGHACSTCFDGVSAQSLRMHRCFPNTVTVFVTDNNISVGRDKAAEIFNDIDVIVSERGQNRRIEAYPALVWQRFQTVRDQLTAQLRDQDPCKFAEYQTITSRDQGTLRDSIDQTGVIFNR